MNTWMYRGGGEPMNDHEEFGMRAFLLVTQAFRVVAGSVRKSAPLLTGKV